MNTSAQLPSGMPYRRCGHSGLLLGAVSLGLWHNFGEGDAVDTMRATLRTAFDHGITHFDLANNYGPPPGAAEEHFGRLFREHFAAHRDEVVIATKAGHPMWPGPYGDWGSRKHLIASIDQSLKRLGLPYVDIFYHHRPDPDTPLEETMGALAHIVRSGRALYVGLSKYDAPRLRQAAAMLRDLGTPCVVHQQRYSLLDQTATDQVLHTLAEERIGAIAFSPLAQGLLTERYLGTDIPADSRIAKGVGFLTREQLTPQRLRVIQALHAVARQRGQPLAQMALTWVLRRPEVSSVLIGASRPQQVLDAVRATRAMPLSEAELRDVDAALAVD
ncbi:aldo/keto reductase [Ideonella sp. BN130291]|uniref:aldo/keto reductase n=1 Tax=Ideonella sp. BN130291 TaxID=3112940 RepID=UPI002E276743|nr:aldo/keto reductase [Ideonella sp. BN130291]